MNVVRLAEKQEGGQPSAETHAALQAIEKQREEHKRPHEELRGPDTFKASEGTVKGRSRAAADAIEI